MNFLTREQKLANKQKKETTDPLLEDEYYEEIEYICPKRGKVKQKVKVKKYKARKASEETTYIPINSQLLTDDEDITIVDTPGEIETETKE